MLLFNQKQCLANLGSLQWFGESFISSLNKKEVYYNETNFLTDTCKEKYVL